MSREFAGSGYSAGTASERTSSGHSKMRSTPLSRECAPSDEFGAGILSYEHDLFSPLEPYMTCSQRRQRIGALSDLSGIWVHSRVRRPCDTESRLTTRTSIGSRSERPTGALASRMIRYHSVKARNPGFAGRAHLLRWTLWKASPSPLATRCRGGWRVRKFVIQDRRSCSVNSCIAEA